MIKPDSSELMANLPNFRIGTAKIYRSGESNYSSERIAIARHS